MAPHRPLDAALVLGLELVVELLADPFPQLGKQRLGIESRSEPLDQRQQQLRVAQIRLDRFGDARVLDLDRHLVAADRDRAMDLAD